MELLTFIMPDTLGWIKIGIAVIATVGLTTLAVLACKDMNSVLDPTSTSYHDSLREECLLYERVMGRIGFGKIFESITYDSPVALFFKHDYRGCSVKVYFKLADASRCFTVYAYRKPEREAIESSAGIGWISEEFSLVTLAGFQSRICSDEVEKFSKAAKSAIDNVVDRFYKNDIVGDVVDKLYNDDTARI